MESREKVVGETLELFQNHDIVVTDRYHGLIFSVICRKPTIVIRTVDHKLTSALHWFKDVSFIRYASDLNQIKELINDVTSVKDYTAPDWNSDYFDQLPKHLDEYNNNIDDAAIVKV
jgi:pyruvyl transferase EpsI